jgi:tRNA pseudouridine13 synthase
MDALETKRLLGFQPLPGRIKSDYDDFVVDEVPLYEPSGQGTHTYFLVEKRGLSSAQAAQDVARALGRLQREIGLAGLKDARALTRQWMSIEHVPPEHLLVLRIPRLRILQATRHTNKLRIGHLSANRFMIRVRDTDTTRLGELRSAFMKLHKLGAPNYFGPQRFGSRGDTWLIGREVIRGNLPAALDQLLGRPSAVDTGEILRARELYDAERYAEALPHWPRLFREERRALGALIRRPTARKRAFLAIPQATRNLYVSAFQSRLFNQVVQERIESLARLEAGDLAWLHRSGAVFEVVDPAAEQERADRFEISPTGPLFGHRMTWPQGLPGAVERRALEESGVTVDAFRSPYLRVKGARRPLRFRADDPDMALGADARGSYIELRFTLPRGCYATSLLREFFQAAPAGDHNEPAE